MSAARQFLTPEHPDAYIDHPTPADQLAQWRKHFPTRPNPSVCPKCNGYGGHNLEVNAYPLPKGMENTPENRRMYCHFRSGCLQCSCWGYVTNPKDAACAHEWDNGTNVGRCLTNYKCSKCGHVIEVDSSD
jgi:hypothetical protein